MEDRIILSQEEALRLYSLLAAGGGEADPILGGLLARLEDHLYLTLTIEEIERLQKRGDSSHRAR